MPPTLAACLLPEPSYVPSWAYQLTLTPSVAGRCPLLTPGVLAEAITPAVGHSLWQPASRAAGRSGFSESCLHEPGPIFWALKADVGIHNWGNVPFGATCAGEVTLCQLFPCPHEHRPSDCSVFSLPLSGSAVLQSAVTFFDPPWSWGTMGSVSVSRVLLHGRIFAYRFQVLNMVDLIESAHNLAFDVADQCHPFNHCLSSPASACSCLQLITGSRNCSSWCSAFPVPGKTSSAETQPQSSGCRCVVHFSLHSGVDCDTFDTG